ncbi:MAG TPA: hypothetical protein VHS53_02380, partial [Mucilaginibacter sp.]|nr:hypothetical protein [Mucilaginibacter sp.]
MRTGQNLRPKLCIPLVILLIIGTACPARAQISHPDSLKADSLGKHGKKVYPPNPGLWKQYDFGDLARNILHPGRKPDSLHHGSGITVVPNISANPTIGFQAGIKAVGGLKLGGDPNTLLSVGATSASITTKGIIYFYVNHNIFTPGNKWNLQGSLVAAKSVTPDHGFGIGDGKDEGNPAQTVLADPTHKGYGINSQYYNFREKVYPPNPGLWKQYDFGDLTRNILHPGRKRDSLHHGSGITVVPNISANPTIGFQAGIKAVGGLKLGGDPNTLLSVGATSASITTKGIIYFYVNHNIFTPGNKWNLQGSLVAAKSVTPDHGFGIGDGKDEGNPAQTVLADPTHKGYGINSQYY